MSSSHYFVFRLKVSTERVCERPRPNQVLSSRTQTLAKTCSSPLLYQLEVLVLFVRHNVDVLAEYVLVLGLDVKIIADNSSLLITEFVKNLHWNALTRNRSAGKLVSRRASAAHFRTGDSVESKSMLTLSVVTMTLPGCFATISFCRPNAV